MKKVFILMFAAVLAAVSCAQVDVVTPEKNPIETGVGLVSVSLKYAVPVSKAIDDYDFVLSEESQVYDVEVLVFDEETGRLERSLSLDSVTDECVMELPIGRKVVYALVNGPDVSRIRNLEEFLQISDSLEDRDYMEDGFVMLGNSVCEVKKDVVAKPEVLVGRMVSRVVLRSVRCNIARQYESLSVDCVFLGNANIDQSIGGNSSHMVNIDGYQDVAKEFPIGLDGKVGACQQYLYRRVGSALSVGQIYDQPVCMYCQPNESQDYTCLYMLVTIDGEQYYYRAELDKGLRPNASCAIDAVITNVGSALPPDGLVQKGELEVVISIDDWAMGYLYNAEF